MKVSIVGGGITGLSTALALQKCGIDSVVYEQSPELRPVGAGIWMQPNALKVLDWMGVGDAVRQNGVSLNRPDLVNAQLEPFRKTKSDLSVDASGEKIVAIHRARLQKVLYEALPAGTVCLGRNFSNIQRNDEEFTLQFTDGVEPAEMIIGADGIHSKVRESIFSDTQLRYSGQTSWRGIAKMNLPERFFEKGLEAWGKSIRFGFSPISEDEVYWFAVAKAPEGQKDPANIQSDLLKLFQEFNPLVSEIISNTEKIIRADIHDLKRLETWSVGKIGLLGDAAHATTPNMGQGGCQGIEDAYYFATTLSSASSLKAAFQQFEEKRREKVDYVVNNSWRFGQLAHSKWGQKLAIVMMKITPESAMKKQMEKLYKVDIN